MEDKAQIQEAIKAQGEVVRKLKSEKASKEQVSVWLELACVIVNLSQRVCSGAASTLNWSLSQVEFGLNYSMRFCSDML